MRPRSGAEQAGDHADDAGLAGARRPEQRGRAAGAGELARFNEKSPSFLVDI